MIELRWVWHHYSSPLPPPLGAIAVVNGILTSYQKLQYRNGHIGKVGVRWDDWTDIPHAGLPAPPTEAP